MRSSHAGWILALAFLTVVSSAATAQSFYLTCPGDRSASVPVGEVHQFDLPIVAPTGSDGSVEVHFEAFMPDGWFGQWCQTSTGICYFGDQTIDLPIDTQDDLQIDFFPDATTPGMGWINMEVRSTSDPLSVQRCTFALYSGLPLQDASFQVDCSDNIAYPESGSELQEFFSPMENLRDQADSLFVRIYTDVPASWFAQFCQSSNGICYFDQGTLSLAPGVLDSVKVDVFTFGEDGDGIVDLEFHSTNNPSIFKWCHYQVYQGNGAPSGVGPVISAPTTLTTWARPNPFSDATMFALRSQASAEGALRIYAADGRLVRTFGSLALSPGVHQIAWDGRDDGGAAVPSGVYFYQWSAGSATAKGMIVRTR